MFRRMLAAVGKVATYAPPSPLTGLILLGLPLYAWLSINGSLLNGRPYGA